MEFLGDFYEFVVFWIVEGGIRGCGLGAFVVWVLIATAQCLAGGVAGGRSGGELAAGFSLGNIGLREVLHGVSWVCGDCERWSEDGWKLSR